MMKRKLFFIALLALMTSTTLHAYDAEIDGIYYNFSGNEAEVTYYGKTQYTGAVTIPSSVTYEGSTYSVTSIGDKAFRSCSSLTSVSIPNSVTSIGLEGFYGCNGLTSVTIPNSVTSIGNLAFSFCSGLTSIVVESGNTKYNSRNNCNAIIETATNTLIAGCKNTTIPNSVTSIGSQAFSDCRSLTSITIPNSVTSIGDGAFGNCYGLTSVTIGSSVTSIGDYAFSYCNSLTSIIIPNSVTSIGVSPFSGCRELTDITVETGNTKYDSRNNCNAIIETATNTLIAGCKNTTIPNSVTSIGEHAFSNCGNLTAITIPNSVTSIGYAAFYDCHSLTSITIPNSVTSIGDRAFNYCYRLTSITIPNSVTSIGHEAFSRCSGLTSVTIGGSVKSIGYYAFSYCSSLTSVTIGGSVKSIGYYAFDFCENLTSVVSKIVEPFTFDLRAFTFISSECVLTVPKGTRDVYINKGWTTSVFKGGIIEGEGVPMLITSAGYATFYEKYGDVIIPEGLKAYTAIIRNGSVALTEILDGKVPAKTPVVLKGAADTYEFSYTTGAEAVGENQLKVSAGSLTADGTQYALTKKNGIVGFNKIKVGTAIPEGKVYLQAPSAGVKAFFALDDDEATGISLVTTLSEREEAIYNVVGQRISKMQRGINIVNGKKILK